MVRRTLCMLALLSQPVVAQASTEAFEQLIESYDEVGALVREGRVTEARDAIAGCEVPSGFSARRTLDEIDTLLQAAQRTPSQAPASGGLSAQKNNYPIGVLASVGAVVTHDLQRLDLLQGNPTPAAELERRALVASAKALFATVDYLAARPDGYDDAWAAGLLHAGGALLGVEELLVEAGELVPEVTYVAERIAEGMDPLTALRLGRGWRLHRALTRQDTTLSSDPESDLLVLGWIAMSDWTSPQTRGDAALLGLDLTDVDALWVSEELSGERREDFRRWFTEAAVGTSEACEPTRADPIFSTDRQLPGGTPAQASSAAERAFRWLPTLDGDVHALEGPIAGMTPAAQQVLLCHVAMRAEAEASVPAALALAERVFFASQLVPGLPTDDKAMAYGLALTAVRNAALLRERGQVPAQEWWVQNFGELLVPLLNPMYAPMSSNAVKFLEEWARTESSDWLGGRVEAPTWMAELVTKDEDEDEDADDEAREPTAAGRARSPQGRRIRRPDLDAL